MMKIMNKSTLIKHNRPFASAFHPILPRHIKLMRHYITLKIDCECRSDMFNDVQYRCTYKVIPCPIEIFKKIENRLKTKWKTADNKI